MSSPVNNQTPVKAVGDLILAKREINATSKLGKFILKGETDNKTISENRALRAFLRFVAGLSLITVVVPSLALAIDGVDTLRCKVLNSKTNSTIDKVETVVNRLVRTADTQSDLRTYLKNQELPAAVKEFQAIALKRANGVTGGSFQRQLDVFADGKALIAKKINNVVHNQTVAKTFVEESYRTLVKTSAAEISSSFPVINKETAEKQAAELAKFAGETLGLDASKILGDIYVTVRGLKTDAEVSKHIKEITDYIPKLNADHADFIARQRKLKSEHDALEASIKTGGETNNKRIALEKEINDLNEVIKTKVNLLSSTQVSQATKDKINNPNTASQGIGELFANYSKMTPAERTSFKSATGELLDNLDKHAEKVKEHEAVVKGQLETGKKCEDMARRFKRGVVGTEDFGFWDQYNANLLLDDMKAEKQAIVDKLNVVLNAKESASIKAASNRASVESEIKALKIVLDGLNGGATSDQKEVAAKALIEGVNKKGEIYGFVYSTYFNSMDVTERNRLNSNDPSNSVAGANNFGVNACFTAAEKTAGFVKLKAALNHVIKTLQDSIVD